MDPQVAQQILASGRYKPEDKQKLESIANQLVLPPNPQFVDLPSGNIENKDFSINPATGKVVENKPLFIPGQEGDKAAIADVLNASKINTQEGSNRIKQLTERQGLVSPTDVALPGSAPVTPKSTGGVGGVSNDPYSINNIVKSEEINQAYKRAGFENAAGLLDRGAQLDIEAVKAEAELKKKNDEKINALDAEAEANHKRRVAQAENAEKELSSMKVDPHRMWSNLGTGNKVLAIIGLALGGAGGRGNQAIPVLMKAVDDDIDAQKTDLENKHSLYNKMLYRFHDEDSAAAAARIKMLEDGIRKLDILTTNNKVPKVQLNADLMKAQLEQQKMQSEVDFKKAQYALTHPHVGGSGAKTAEKAAGVYSEQAQKAGIPEQEATLEMLGRTLANKNPNTEIPGTSFNVVSRAARGTLDFLGGAGTGSKTLDTPQERADSQAYNDTLQSMLHVIQGAAYSEAQKQLFVDSLSKARTWGDLQSTYGRLKQKLESEKNAIRAGVNPAGVELYEGRKAAYNQSTNPQQSAPAPSTETRGNK